MQSDRNSETTIYGNRWFPYILIVPGVLYLLVFQAIPFIQEMRLAFSNTSLLNPSQFRFVGMRNFSRLFYDHNFSNSIYVTIIYVISSVVGTTLLGLFAAILLDRQFMGRSFVRSLLIIPWAAPPVAVALVFRWMLNGQYGVINKFFDIFGLAPQNGLWLENPAVALPTVIAITIWQLFPFTSIVILAALQSVPKEIREAAEIDGAGIWMQFKVVIWPVIQPTVALLALLMTIWSIRRFEIIWLLTQGGPIGSSNTLIVDLYRRGFILNKLGDAAAVGMIGMAVSMVIVIIHFAMSNYIEQKRKEI